jgi:DNA-binding transcriptional LysR family regulator
VLLGELRSRCHVDVQLQDPLHSLEGAELGLKLSKQVQSTEACACLPLLESDIGTEPPSQLDYPVRSPRELPGHVNGLPLARERSVASVGSLRRRKDQPEPLEILNRCANRTGCGAVHWRATIRGDGVEVESDVVCCDITYHDAMELRQLRYLSAAARAASITRAASALHVVQPAVSQQIRRLEAELGVDLLHRTGGLRPTRIGEQVIIRAERILAEVDALLDEVNAERGLLTGRMAIGSMQWLGSIDLPALVGSFLADYPDVEITLSESTAAVMLDAVRQEKLDLVFFSAHLLPLRSQTNGVDVCVLAEEEMVVVGRGDFLDGMPDPLPLSALHERRFVGFAEGMDVRTLVQGLLDEAGVTPDLVLESNELATVCACADQGIGYSILPRRVAESMRGLATRSVAPSPAHRQLALGWRSNHRLPPAAAAFRERALSAATSG